MVGGYRMKFICALAFQKGKIPLPWEYIINSEKCPIAPIGLIVLRITVIKGNTMNS